MRTLRGLAIVVNYNQELEIARFLKALPAGWPVEDTVLVDDGSTDRSPSIAESLGFKVLRHPSNRGVGATIRTGIRHGQQQGYDYAFILSSNGKMRVSDIPTVIGPILRDEADYVQGSRFRDEGRSIDLTLFRRLMIPCFTLLASLVLGRRFTDITCGFRAYRLGLFTPDRIDIDQDWLDRYELEYYIHYRACRSGARVVEVPVTIDYSHLAKGRKSKIVPFVGWWSMVRPFVLLTIRWKR